MTATISQKFWNAISLGYTPEDITERLLRRATNPAEVEASLLADFQEDLDPMDAGMVFRGLEYIRVTAGWAHNPAPVLHTGPCNCTSGRPRRRPMPGPDRKPGQRHIVAELSTPDARELVHQPTKAINLVCDLKNTGEVAP